MLQSFKIYFIPSLLIDLFFYLSSVIFSSCVFFLFSRFFLFFNVHFNISLFFNVLLFSLCFPLSVLAIREERKIKLLEVGTITSEKIKETEEGSINSLDKDEEKSENTIELSGIDGFELDVDVEATGSNVICFPDKLVESRTTGPIIETKV